MRNDEALLASFFQRVPRAVIFYAGRALGAAMSGASISAEDNRYRELHLAFVRLNRAHSTLTLAEQVRVAAYFFPLVKAAGAAAAPLPEVPQEIALRLSFASLPARIRGVVEPPLMLTGTVSGPVPVGTQLVILRDGIAISRTTAAAGVYSVLDVSPGLRYEVVLSGTGQSRQQVRALRSPVLAGTGPAGMSEQELTLLPVAADSGRSPLRLVFSGSRNRIHLLVPVERGTMSRITQPNDNDSNITATFSRRFIALDFGVDGVVEYEHLKNSADFIGSFTLDLYLI